MMLAPQQEVFIVPPGTVTTTTNHPDHSDLAHSGGMFYLNITAASGTTPTLDIKIQNKCVLTGVYYDIVGASFTQKTGTGTDYLIVSDDVTAIANRAVSQALGATFRAVSTIGGTTPSFTYSLVYVPV